MNLQKITVGSFPFAPGFNPYQDLMTNAIEESGVNVVRIPPKKWFPLQTAGSADCDLLHLDWPHDWYNGKNFFTHQLKKWMYLRGLKTIKQKVVWTLHNLAAHDANDMEFERRMIQKLLDRCNGVVVFSEFARRRLKEEYSVSDKTEIRRVNHGHYCDSYPNTCSRSDARRALNVGESEKLIVSIGSIKPYKGHDKLIDIAANCKSLNAKWIIAGSSRNKPYGDQLQSKIDSANRKGSKIELHRKLIQDEELQLYFNAADLCVLPFDNVLNSGSLLLAMSFGCPVIAPAMGSIPEVINPEWGFLYDYQEQQSISKTLQIALEKISKTPHDIIRSSGIAFARQRYEWKTTGRKVKQLYQRLLT